MTDHDFDRVEELRAEHVSLLLAVGLAFADPQPLHEASTRLAGRDHDYHVSALLRAAQLLDEQLGRKASPGLIALRHQLNEFVGDHGDVLDTYPGEFDDGSGE